MQSLVDAAATGSLYALVAVGLSIVFGVLKLTNFAHGDVMMVGAFTTVLLIGVGMPFIPALFCLVAFSARAIRRNLGTEHPLARLSLAWMALIVVQVILGAVTIWSNKAADMATAHVVTGALTLVNGALLTIISFRVLMPVRAAAPVAGEPTSSSYSTGKPAASSAK